MSTDSLDTGTNVSRRSVLRATAGAAAIAGPGTATATAQEGGETRPDFGGWLADSDGGFRDARGQDQVTVEVGAQGNGGPFAFGPASLWIDPGTTVTFEWVSDNHNVEVEEQPGDAGWEGHTPIEDTGFSFEHTFETGGLYKYFCNPHRPLGMLGGVAVGDDVPTVQVGGGGDGAGDGDGGPGFTFPGGDAGVAYMLAVYGTLGLTAVLMLSIATYDRLREQGGVRGPRPETTGPVAEAAVEEPAREIGHEEYDPVGTAALIVAYFLILVVMWVFVYFVEFLGNGPTVIG